MKSGTKQAPKSDGNGTTSNAQPPTAGGTTTQPRALKRNGELRLAAFNAGDFLAKAGLGKVIVERTKDEAIFSQGDPADSVFYIQKGKVKVGVVSAQGKEATVAVMSAGE